MGGKEGWMGRLFPGLGSQGLSKHREEEKGEGEENHSD